MRKFWVIAAVLSSLLVAAPTEAASCAAGGACKMGNLGPGGGRIVYVAPTSQWWGTYLEARLLTSGRGMPWSLKPTESLYQDSPGASAVRQRIDSRGLGMGIVNTAAIVAQSGEGRYAAKYISDLTIGRQSDWYLPSLDELDLAYHLTTIGYWRTLYKAAYWTSTENSARYAWYQMFQDSTQFTDENSVGQVDGVGVKLNKNRIRNAKHGQSGFPVLLYRLFAMRAFGPSVGEQPPTSSPALTGNTCTDAGPCQLGDIGPGGGVIFFDAGMQRSWGRYLEASPSTTEAVGLPWKRLSVNDRARPMYVNTSRRTAKLARVWAKKIGMGQANTQRILQVYGRGNYAARYAANLVVNGKDDWFLPSQDELTLMYTFMHKAVPPIDPLKQSFYWSSSEYDFNNTWTVNFKDGQMFDRLKFTVPKSGVKAIRVRAIRSF
jgi:hypothetical protein